MFEEPMMNGKDEPEEGYPVFPPGDYNPISIDEFIRSSVELNPHIDPAELRPQIEETVRRKKTGARCMNCGAPIWAIGTAICGWDACFPCVTGSADDSDDYEIDEVCW